MISQARQVHHQQSGAIHLRRQPGLAALVRLCVVLLLLAGCGSLQPPTAGQPLWPSPVPAPPAYPTMEPRRWLGGSDPHATFQLPGVTFDVHVAVHPTQGWPAVAVLQRYNEGSDPIQAFVRVLNPQTGQWSAAQQVDIGAASNGMDRFGSALVGITGDGVVHAVWGGSDAEPTSPDAGGIWTSESRDYGASWSAPQRILTHCWTALDMATTPSGQIVVLANCWRLVNGNGEGHTEFAIRHSNGSWLPAQRLEVNSWFGAVALAGDGQDLRITALTMPFARNNPRAGHLIGKYLADPGPWQVRDLALVPAGVSDPGAMRWQAHHLSFTRLLTDGRVTTGEVFTWSDTERAHAYSLTSLDGGLSFGPVVPIVIDDSVPQDTGAKAPAVFAAAAYDPIADRLVAIWTCCQEAQYERIPVTHYASWSVPGSTSWTPPNGAGRIPTILGSRSAHRTATAQAPMSRWTWVAWVEGPNQITVRSFDLNKIIPIDQYPTATPVR
jgi:hypothetical protein